MVVCLITKVLYLVRSKGSWVRLGTGSSKVSGIKF